MYQPQVLFARIVKLPRAGNVGATKVIFWEQSKNKQHNIIVVLLILSNTHVQRKSVLQRACGKHHVHIHIAQKEAITGEIKQPKTLI